MDQLEPLAVAVTAPAADLLLRALGDFHAGSRVLELGAGPGVLTRALAPRLAAAGATLWATEPSLDLVRLLPPDVLRLSAALHALPFAADSFEHAVANLALGRRSEDPARLAELRRVLKPFGRLTATVLLEGSLDELIDLYLEACESEDERALAAVLRAGREELLDARTAGALLADAGFEVQRSGIEERALCFANGAEAMAHPFAAGGFLALLVPPGEVPPPVAPGLPARIEQAIDRYFGAHGFSVTFRTGVAQAELSTKDLQFQGVPVEAGAPGVPSGPGDPP